MVSSEPTATRPGWLPTLIAATLASVLVSRTVSVPLSVSTAYRNASSDERANEPDDEDLVT